MVLLALLSSLPLVVSLLGRAVSLHGLVVVLPLASLRQRLSLGVVVLSRLSLLIFFFLNVFFEWHSWRVSRS